MLVLKEITAGIATLILNRPDVRNALNAELITALRQEIEACCADPAIRVIVLKGAGDHFCAGADLRRMQASASISDEEGRREAAKFADLLYFLDQAPKPTVAVVQGSVYGGGIGLVTACDIAVADTSAVFCLSEVRLGIVPGIISPYVIRAMGVRQMRRYALTAERISALEALEFGLVHHIGAAEPILKHLLSGGPQAQAATKDLITAVACQPITEALGEVTSHRIADICKTPEAQEGFAAFFEKRKPSW